MTQHFRIAFFTLLIFATSSVFAQSDTIRYDVSFTGLAATGEYAPFWLNNAQYGKMSEKPLSSNLLLGIYKEFGTKKRTFDYSFKASALLRTDADKTNLYFHELYAKARLSVFDMTIGAREEIIGNQDSTLSSGGLLFSQNARPMPKVTIGIEHFTTVPFTFGLIEIKGGLSHGWFARNDFIENLWLHHKYFYGRIGGNLPVHFQYGLDHAAQWGGKSLDPKVGQQPTGLKDYISIFLGNAGDANAIINDQINTLGNHIISQSMRLDIDIKDWKIGGYWQNISEDGPVEFITKTMNQPDGLWGISIRNNHFPFIKGIVYEYLNTTDQSGPYHDNDGIVYGGSDSYFNNYPYGYSWSNSSRTIGTPFITSILYNKDGSPFTPNNRVQMHHIGIEGDICNYKYRLFTSVSKNYGTYGDSELDMKKSTSVMLEIAKQFPKLSNIEVGCTAGGDFGKLFGNSVGFMLSIRKRGALLNY